MGYGVFVHGMEMPDGCEDCPLVEQESVTWECRITGDDATDDDYVPLTERPWWCPLVKI